MTPHRLAIECPAIIGVETSPLFEMAKFDWIIDVETGRLISSFLSTRATTPLPMVYGDKPTVSARFVERNGNNADVPWRQLDLTGQTAKVGIGNPGGDPKAGTYTLTFSAEQTTPIDFDADAATVSTAFNLLAAVVTAGGVVVTDYLGGFRFTWVTFGDKGAITSTTAALTPATTAFITETTTGTGSVYEVVDMVLETDPAAFVELTDDIDDPSIAITTVRAGVTGTVAEQQRMIISGDPWAGTYSLNVDSELTGAIPFDASTDEIVAALEALASIGEGNVTVTGNAVDFTVEFNKSLGDVGEATGDVTNLSGSIGKTGTLDLDVVGVLELLNGKATEQAKLEIVRFTTSGSISDTVYQQAVTVNQDVIV